MHLAILVALLTFFWPGSADAHGARTAYLEVIEIGAGSATAHLRMNVPEPSLALAAPEGCALEPIGETAFGRSARLACPGGLAGKRLELRGLGPVINDAVAWIAYADGSSESALLRPDRPAVDLRRADGTWDVARAYIRLGVTHILGGYDHLLFLLLLCLALETPRRVLLAETAFTLSHSLSFASTALGFVRVSSAAAEACIALSLLLMALEARRRAHLGALAGAVMAFVFGLVHGLGFAGGLREIGVPERAVGAALVGFAAGVEIGQVAFLALLLALLYAFRRTRALPRATVALVYAAGGLSAYWLFERLMTLLPRS